MTGRRSRPGAAGLTLVELVVALAIGGILVGLAVNGSGMLASRRLVGAARTLASDMRTLEQRARAERTCYRIVFDPTGDAYNMDRYDPARVAASPALGGSHCPDVSAWAPQVFRQDAADTVSRRMPSGVDLITTTFGADTLTYGPFGNPNGGSVTLRTPAGMERRVVVEVTGRVTIQP